MKGSKKVSSVQFSLGFLQFCMTKPSCSLFGWWRILKFLIGVQHLDLDLHMGLWRMLKVPDCSLASWSWFRYGHCSLICLWFKLWLAILILKLQRTSMSFKSSFGALEDAGGSWPGFGILIFILIWYLVFGSPIFQTLDLYLDFEDAKNIHVL